MTARQKKSEQAQPRQAVPIVINNTEGPRYIPYGGVSDGGVGVIDLKRMKFASGFNAPQDPDEFAIVSEFEVYKQWVRDGVLTEVQDVSEITTVGGATGSVIDSSASKASIEHWRKIETRSSVISLLDAKLAEFKRFHTPGGD